jgi:ubiquinone/menaquinone biosynthesis C-methylase UbiE
LPYADASFDLVYSWGVLHHTPNTQRALDEAHRVLKRDGTLKLMLYHRHSWVALAAWGAKGLARGRLLTLKQAIALTESPGTKAFTSKEVREMLREFRQVEVRPHLTSWDRKFVPGLSRLGNNRFGWFLLIKATK